MLKIALIVNLLFPPTLFARLFVQEPFSSEEIQKIKEESVLPTNKKPVNKDCVSCNYNYKDQTLTSNEKGLQEVFDAMNTDDFSPCFDKYHSISGGRHGINTIDQHNSIYVCSCIADIMKNKPIKEAKKTVSLLAQGAIAVASVPFAVEDIRVEAKSVENDLAQLPHSSSISCDIDTYIQQKQASCNNAIKLTIQSSIEKPLGSKALQFKMHTPFTVDDFLVAPPLANAFHAINQAIQNGELSMTQDDLAQLSDREIKNILERINLQQVDTASFFGRSYNLSRATNQNGTSQFSQALHSSREFGEFISQNYLSALPNDDPIKQEITRFFEDSSKNSLAVNRRKITSLLQQNTHLLAEKKCNSIKRKFDSLCHVTGVQEIPSIFPQTYERAYSDVYKMTTNPEGFISIPGLRSLDRLLNTFSHSLTEVTHMVSCQNYSQSLQSVYNNCPKNIPHDQMNAEQIEACSHAQEIEGLFCQSYQTLFEKDDDFKQLIVNADIGITMEDENLNKLLFPIGAEPAPKLCMQGNDHVALAKFRQLAASYLGDSMLKHTFATDVFTTDTYGTPKKESSNNSDPYSNLSKILNDAPQTYDNDRIVPDGEHSMITNQNTIDTIPHEIESMIPQELDAQEKSTSAANNLMGPFNPSTSYSTQSKEEMKKADPVFKNTPNENNDAQISALMKEIEVLNQKLAKKNDEIETNTNAIAKNQRNSEPTDTLEQERERLLLEQQELLREKMKRENEITQIQKEQTKMPQEKQLSKQQQSSLSKETNRTASLPTGGATSSAKGFSSATPIPSSENVDTPVTTQIVNDSDFSLSSVVIRDREEVEQFFNNQKTFTEAILYLVDPKNQNMMIKCELDQKKSAGKKEFTKMDYDCSAPAEKTALILENQPTPPPAAQQEQENAKEKKLKLKSFNEVKKIIDQK